MSSPTFSGIDTIVWGTDGILSTPAGAIVDSVNRKPLDNPNEIKNGKGKTACIVFPSDDFDLEVTCTDDTSKSWPVKGARVNATIDGVTYSCIAGQSSTSKTKGKEGTRTIPLMYREDVV